MLKCNKCNNCDELYFEIQGIKSTAPYSICLNSHLFICVECGIIWQSFDELGTTV